MAQPVVYEQCGLRIRSELQLALPIVGGEGWDVELTWGPDLDETGSTLPGELIASFGQSEEDWWYRATSTADGFLIRFRDRGEFAISSDLSRVEVRCDPAGYPEFLPVLAAGTVMAFLLALRGETVLHASAVAIDGHALAFVGPSGRGKSTLAALLCLDGATLLTDDVLTVDVGPPVTAVGGATELRLREGAAPLADVRRDAPKRVTADRRTALTLEPSPRARLPLGALVLPTPSRTTSEVDVVRLEPSTALFTLLATPRIHGWRRPDVLRRDFGAHGEIVNRVPVYDVRIPWGPPFDPSVARALRALLLDGDGAS